MCQAILLAWVACFSRLISSIFSGVMDANFLHVRASCMGSFRLSTIRVFPTIFNNIF